MYEVGKVYIWQNMLGELSSLNGTECTVTGGAGVFKTIKSCTSEMAQPTDTKSPRSPNHYMAALKGNLRPKNPPAGERLVRDLFEPKPVMEPA